MDSVRPARAADLDDLVRLWSHAVEELDGQRGGEALADTLARRDLPGFLGDALADVDRLLVIGVAGGAPAGLASVRADRDRRRPVGHLELIFVEPGARREGMAAAMLGAAQAACEAWGMTGLDAPALPGSRSAKSFFERQGMQARLLVMHRPLGGGGAGG